MLRIAVAGLAVLLHWVIFLPDAPAQVITTVVGRGRLFRADGSAAISAPLGAVQGVVVDPAGNVFVSDSYYHLVVKVSTSGVLSVVAGNGIAGFSGDGGPATGAAWMAPATRRVPANSWPSFATAWGWSSPRLLRARVRPAVHRWRRR